MNYLYSTMMYINVLWTQMSRQWMYYTNRRSKEFLMVCINFWMWSRQISGMISCAARAAIAITRSLQQQQQHSLFSQASWGRLEMKPERNKFRVQAH